MISKWTTATAAAGRRARLQASLAAILAILVVVGPARAQAPPAPPPSGAQQPPAASADLVIAKELFRQGVALLEAGDVERALDYFLKSRAAYPSSKNTGNAAICLDRLGRFDEALEMYEELLVKHAGELDDDDKASIGPAMAALRQKVGSIMVSANVEGAVIIDGRPRGKLPLANDIRVLRGKRSVRVLREGFEAYEGAVDVAPGDRITLNARLKPLAASGVLRVEDPGNEGAEVFVDQIRVGTAPWEGTLRTGRHIVWTRKENVGSAPASVVVLLGQTVLVRASSRALGPPVEIDVDPPSAELTLSGMKLGVGSFSGRLPIGTYRLSAEEDGYNPESTLLRVSEARKSPIRITLSLTKQEADDRRPEEPPGHPWIGAFGGYAGGSSLGSDAERGCPGRCSEEPFASGFVIGARSGYRLQNGLGIDAQVGYLDLGTSFTRYESDTFTVKLDKHTIDYQFKDDLSVRGPLVGAGASYRAVIDSPFAFVSRVMVGVLFASARDPIAATANPAGNALDLAVARRFEPVSAPSLFVAPELGLDVSWGGFHGGVSLGLMFFPMIGPAFAHPEVGNPVARCDPETAAVPVECAPNSDVLADERAFGLFTVWLPQVTAGYSF